LIVRLRLIALLAATSSLYGCAQISALASKIRPSKDAATPSEAKSEGAKERVAPIAVSQGDVVDSVTVDGVVRAEKRLEIRADRAMKIAKKHAAVMAPVKTGDRLIEVDKTEILKRLADLDERLRRSRIDMNTLDVQLAHKRKLVERKAALQAKDVVPLRELEEAQRDLRIEENNQATKRLDFQKLEAELAEAQNQAKAADVVSPMNGLIAEVTGGNDVREGDVVAVVVDPSRFSLWALVDEQNRLRLKVGEKAQVVLEAASDKELSGVVGEIGVTPERGAMGGVKNFQVRVDFDAKGIDLAEGYRGKVTFVFAQARAVTMIPRAAIRRSGDKAFALVRKAGSLGSGAALEAIEVGVEGALDAEVKSGLAVGDTVMVGY